MRACVCVCVLRAAAVLDWLPATGSLGKPCKRHPIRRPPPPDFCHCHLPLDHPCDWGVRGRCLEEVAAMETNAHSGTLNRGEME